MTKEEILKELLELYNLITSDREELSKQFKIESEDYYPFLSGFTKGRLELILLKCKKIKEGKYR